jgi:hypothetical protein
MLFHRDSKLNVLFETFLIDLEIVQLAYIYGNHRDIHKLIAVELNLINRPKYKFSILILLPEVHTNL